MVEGDLYFYKLGISKILKLYLQDLCKRKITHSLNLIFELVFHNLIPVLCVQSVCFLEHKVFVLLSDWNKYNKWKVRTISKKQWTRQRFTLVNNFKNIESNSWILQKKDIGEKYSDKRMVDTYTCCSRSW